MACFTHAIAYRDREGGKKVLLYPSRYMLLLNFYCTKNRYRGVSKVAKFVDAAKKNILQFLWKRQKSKATNTTKKIRIK